MRFVILVLAATLAVTAQLPAAERPAEPAASADAEGLVKVNVPGLQNVYAQPGADLSRYTKVMLDPIEVSFSRTWQPETAHRRMTAQEKQEIRTGLARVLRDELVKELARSKRYQVVESPGDDVLSIRAEIRDLRINAPDLPRPETVRTYTMSAGEMTLVAELRDSSSGALVARVIDRYRDPETQWLQLTTRIDNIAAARRAAADWSRILREQLDAAHGIGAKKSG